jgi:uncharacterized protein YdiU (UPF0061 family)
MLLRWQNISLANTSFASFKAEINLVLRGQKGWIEENLKSKRATLINAQRYDLLLYLLGRHLHFLTNNDFIKEAKSVKDLEIVSFMNLLDFKQISQTLDNAYKDKLAQKLLFNIAKLGDYKLLEKYLDGLSRNIAEPNQRLSRLMCLSVSKQAFDQQDPIKIMNGTFYPKEIATVLKCYAVHAPQKYESVNLYLKNKYPLEFSRNITVFTQQINFYLNQKNISKAKSLLQSMFAEKLPIEPTVILSIVSGFFNAGLPLEAVAFFNKVVSMGYDPGSKSFSAMIIGCLKNGISK